MHRLLSLSLLGIIICLSPSDVQAKTYSYRISGSVWRGHNYLHEIEQSYNHFMDTASILAGAPKGGRALQSQDPSRFDPPSAFERKKRKKAVTAVHFIDNAAVASGSGRKIDKFKTIKHRQVAPYKAYAGSTRNGIITNSSPPSITPQVKYDEPTTNRDYDDHLASGPQSRNRRELTSREKKVIFNQKSVY